MALEGTLIVNAAGINSGDLIDMMLSQVVFIEMDLNTWEPMTARAYIGSSQINGTIPEQEYDYEYEERAAGP